MARKLFANAAHGFLFLADTRNYVPIKLKNNKQSQRIYDKKKFTKITDIPDKNLSTRNFGIDWSSVFLELGNSEVILLTSDYTFGRKTQS